MAAEERMGKGSGAAPGMRMALGASPLVQGEAELVGEVLQIVYMPVREVAKWDRNPKRHDIDGMKRAFAKHGFRDAPIWDAALDSLAAGNGRATALDEMERDGDPVPRGVLTRKGDGRWCMPVQVGVDAATRKAAEAFAVDHNNLTIAGSEISILDAASMWDEAAYLELAKELGEGLTTLSAEGLEQLEMALYEPEPIPAGEPTGAQVDRAEELQQEWGTEPGQLWRIDGDRHRIVCADASIVENWNRMIGDNAPPVAWCWTDPPYGVSYVGRTADKLEMESDDTDEALKLTAAMFAILDYFLEPGAPIYVAHPSGPLSVEFGRLFKEQGWHYHQTLTWVKNVMVMGHSDYHYQHEPIIYGWKPGSHPWYGGRDKVTTLFVDRPSRSTYHPTMKPVELVELCVMNSSKPDALGVDPFMGAGATLIAAHALGRRCYGMDVDPRYVAVALQRFADLGVEVEGPVPL